jgi:hypothetical protein
MAAVKDQGWRGIVLHTTDAADAKLKAEVLTELERGE